MCKHLIHKSFYFFQSIIIIMFAIIFPYFVILAALLVWYNLFCITKTDI